MTPHRHGEGFGFYSSVTSCRRDFFQQGAVAYCAVSTEGMYPCVQLYKGAGSLYFAQTNPTLCFKTFFFIL